jgi:hypothetical protein
MNYTGENEIWDYLGVMFNELLFFVVLQNRLILLNQQADARR